MVAARCVTDSTLNYVIYLHPMSMRATVKHFSRDIPKAHGGKRGYREIHSRDIARLKAGGGNWNDSWLELLYTAVIKVMNT